MKELMLKDAAKYLAVSEETFAKLDKNRCLWAGTLPFDGAAQLFPQEELDRILEQYLITDDGKLLQKDSNGTDTFFMTDYCKASIEKFFSEYGKEPWHKSPAHIVGFTYVSGKPIPQVLGFCVYNGEADRQERFGECYSHYDESCVLAFVCPWCGKVHFHHSHVLEHFVYRSSQCDKVDGYIVLETKDPEQAGFYKKDESQRHRDDICF